MVMGPLLVFFWTREARQAINVHMSFQVTVRIDLKQAMQVPYLVIPIYKMELIHTSHRVERRNWLINVYSPFELEKASLEVVIKSISFSLWVLGSVWTWNSKGTFQIVLPLRKGKT